MHDAVEQHGAISDDAAFLDLQAQDQRPVIKHGGGRSLVMEATQQVADRPGDCCARQRALDDHATFAQMAMNDEPALDRIHRAVNPLDRVR